MISFVKGTVVSAAVDHVVVDVGAVGLHVLCTPTVATSLHVGDRVELRTSLIVREDAWTLYGFLDDEERGIFEQVQTVSGIGPRIALALLGTLSPDELRNAVSSKDESALMSVSGIGRKGAQRLILELADRLGPARSIVGGTASTITSGGWRSAVSAGLVSLGWSAKEADAAVGALDVDLVESADAQGDDADVSVLLKAALRGLDRS